MIKLSKAFFQIIAVSGVLNCAVILAQDTRTVTQPTIPTACTKLFAALKSANGDLPSADESRFDTSRIQSAINGCASGQAVELALNGANDSFLIQPIALKSGVTLLIDSGVTVFASRNPRDYDQASGSCGIVATSSAGCKPVISASSTPNAGIMGKGTINGRGGDALIGVSPSVTWWQLARNAQTLGQSQFNPILVSINASNNFTIFETTFKNSPIFHIVYKSGNGFTVWGITINTPFTSRNTDGIDVGQSQNVTITQSTISDGDDEVAVGGSGGPTSNVTISNNHFFNGHGISIGSFTTSGVSNMVVNTLSISGDPTDTNSNGIRIKSAADRGGVVQNISYNGVCMRNIAHPLQFNPHYNTNSGTKIPLFTNIGVHNVHVLTNGKVQIEGFDASHKSQITLDNVVFDSLSSSNVTSAQATVALGPGPVSSNLSSVLTGTGVTVQNRIVNSNSPRDCTNAWGTAP